MKAKILIETKTIDELIQSKAKYNPRIISGKAKSGLISSIKSLGYIDPIIYNKRTSTIVSGHQRLDVMIDEGYTEVDVSVIDVSLDVEKKINVTMNNQLITGNYTEQLSEIIIDFDLEFLDSTFINELDIFTKDDEDDEDLNKDSKQTHTKMELMPYESYDCILIVTKTKNDFNFLKEKFGLKKIDASTSFIGKSKIGEARAVDAKVVIELITGACNEVII